MRPGPRLCLLLSCLLTPGPALAGCGSGAGAPAAGPAPGPRPSPPVTQPGSRLTPPAGKSAVTTPTPSPVAPAPRTAVGVPASGPAAAAALAVVRGLGYVPADAGDYHRDQTLRVLLGTRAGGATSPGALAFFFLRDRYLGTDSSLPSARLQVGAQDDTSITLTYTLYRPGEAACCATGGVRDVRFALDNGRLEPMSPIPTAASGAPLSRR